MSLLFVMVIENEDHLYTLVNVINRELQLATRRRDFI